MFWSIDPGRSTWVVETDRLSGVAAEAWSTGRMESVRQRYADRLPFEPIWIAVATTRKLHVGDGNHRLMLARELHAPHVLVTFTQKRPPKWLIESLRLKRAPKAS